MMRGGQSPTKEGMEGDISGMSHMMTEMMPYCLEMMLPNVTKEKRIDFVLNMVNTLVEKGSAGMSAEEKEDFLTELEKRIKT